MNQLLLAILLCASLLTAAQAEDCVVTPFGPRMSAPPHDLDRGIPSHPLFLLTIHYS